jgi:hypothetical protein
MKTVTGKFTIESKEATNGNKRYIALGEDGKQVGSTFDSGLGSRLQSFAVGAVLELEIDDSGRFWDITGAKLADDGAVEGVQADAPQPTAGRPTFSERDLTFFMGNAARIVSALIETDVAYRERINKDGDPVKAAHEDVVFGALTLLNEVNKRA